LIHGTGTKVNLVEGVSWLERATIAGDVEAQVHLAQCVEKGLGVAASADRAFGLYTQAANRGDVVAMEHVARCYAAGIGVGYVCAMSTVIVTERGVPFE
jgi:TPR repeat protein